MTLNLYAEVPPRLEYAVAAPGKSLRPTLDSLAGWMRGNAGQLRAQETDAASCP